MENYNMAAKAGKEVIIKFLSDRMETLGLTRYALSKKCGVSETTLSRFFDGSQDITLLNYLKILGALEIRPYLIAKEDDDNEMNFMNFN